MNFENKNMVVGKILCCPICWSPDAVVSLIQNEYEKYLYCSSCLRKFIYDKDNNFFLFFEGECKSTGTPITERENDFYTNENFRNLCLKYSVFEISKLFDKYKPKMVVDVGCGSGIYAYYLKDLYCEYYGLEPFDVPPQIAVSTSKLPENAILIRYDATKNLPVRDSSADMITLISSYDHIPDVKNTIKNVYNKLKNGGYLLIFCSNYDFWAKRLINKITGKKMFQHKNIHFDVYSPSSLIKEIKSFVNVKVEDIQADFFFLPNLPKAINFLYFNVALMNFVNILLKSLFSIFPFKNSGSSMIIVFKK